MRVLHTQQTATLEAQLLPTRHFAHGACNVVTLRSKGEAGVPGSAVMRMPATNH
jgi:hypothetical protein